MKLPFLSNFLFEYDFFYFFLPPSLLYLCKFQILFLLFNSNQIPSSFSNISIFLSFTLLQLFKKKTQSFSGSFEISQAIISSIQKLNSLQNRYCVLYSGDSVHRFWSRKASENSVLGELKLLVAACPRHFYTAIRVVNCFKENNTENLWVFQKKFWA
ncbi:hypothetical protein Ancab_034816 [Ancistrocladus abbreviatus]